MVAVIVTSVRPASSFIVSGSAVSVMLLVSVSSSVIVMSSSCARRASDFGFHPDNPRIIRTRRVDGGEVKRRRPRAESGIVRSPNLACNYIAHRASVVEAPPSSASSTIVKVHRRVSLQGQPANVTVNVDFLRPTILAYRGNIRRQPIDPLILVRSVPVILKTRD